SGNAFRKFDEAVSRRDNPRRARRFNAGNVVDPIRVPQGRLNVPAGAVLQPPLRDLSRRADRRNVETLGYFQLSLRDICLRISERHYVYRGLRIAASAKTACRTTVRSSEVYT